MMQSSNKKKIGLIEPKKPSTVSPLIKCYICFRNFQSNATYDLHKKQHQNKINGKFTEQIQLKTQQSFRTKKKDLMNRSTTLSLKDQNQKVDEESRDQKTSFFREEQEEDANVEQALRESAILLEKMEFITEIGFSENISKKEEPKQAQQIEQEIVRNMTESELFESLKNQKANEKSIEMQILSTIFDSKFIENYQDQLMHLRKLSNFASTSTSISKIVNIKKQICQQVYRQLVNIHQNYNKIETQEQAVKHFQKNQAKILQNSSSTNCYDCYSPIDCCSEYYSLTCGHTYHLECWDKDQNCCP